MCFRLNGATASRRRSVRLRQAPTLPPLAVLDLSKPGERQAHDFLCRATGRREPIWAVFSMSRQGDSLFCVVRWMRAGKAAKPFSLAEISLQETAVYWHDYASVEDAQAELQRRRVMRVTKTAGTARLDV